MTVKSAKEIQQHPLVLLNLGRGFVTIARAYDQVNPWALRDITKRNELEIFPQATLLKNNPFLRRILELDPKWQSISVTLDDIDQTVLKAGGQIVNISV